MFTHVKEHLTHVAMPSSHRCTRTLVKFLFSNNSIGYLQIPRQRVWILAVKLFAYKVLMSFSSLTSNVKYFRNIVALAHDVKVVACSLDFSHVGRGLSVRCFAKLQFVLSRASWRMTWYQRGHAVLQQIPNPCLNICRRTLSLLFEAEARNATVSDVFIMKS